MKEIIGGRERRWVMARKKKMKWMIEGIGGRRTIARRKEGMKRL